MKTKRKTCQVIMLPTENQSKIVLQDDLKNIILHKYKGYSTDRHTTQHIYILSKESINLGDLTYHETFGLGKIILHKEIKCYKTISRYKNDGSITSPLSNLNTLKKLKKVIATTNDNFNFIPKPSEAFIAKYCGLNGKIHHIDVEYEIYQGLKTTCEEIRQVNEERVWDRILIDERIKLNQKNEICIHPVKDTWTAEEMLELINKILIEFSDYTIADKNILDFIDKNK